MKKAGPRPRLRGSGARGVEQLVVRSNDHPAFTYFFAASFFASAFGASVLAGAGVFCASAFGGGAFFFGLFSGFFFFWLVFFLSSLFRASGPALRVVRGAGRWGLVGG